MLSGMCGCMFGEAIFHACLCTVTIKAGIDRKQPGLGLETARMSRYIHACLPTLLSGAQQAMLVPCLGPWFVESNAWLPVLVLTPLCCDSPLCLSVSASVKGDGRPDLPDQVA